MGHWRLFDNMRTNGAAWLLLLMLALLPGVSLGDSVPNVPVQMPDVSAWRTDSFIGGNAVTDIAGFTGINMAAGQENLQINAAAIALGGDSALGIATVQSQQALLLSNGSVPESCRARITDHAFSNGSGAFSINQASGLGNVQANGIAIGVGRTTHQMSDMELAQSITIPTDLKDKMQAGGGHREAVVGARTFSGTRGIVQVNQTAGSGNATANGFSLNVGAGVQ